LGEEKKKYEAQIAEANEMLEKISRRHGRATRIPPGWNKGRLAHIKSEREVIGMKKFYHS